ncbi:MAG: LysR family transcriptional regulator [Candidatus Heteroscillospira sp.]
MDTKVCEYILEIARQKSITKAAESLNISQSALSQCLIRVEKELGAPLFRRRKTSLAPTEAGKLYIEAASRTVELKRRLKADIASMTRKKRIRLGVSSMWGMDMMIELIPMFREKFPDVTLELKNGNFTDLSANYLQGKLDMAVTSCYSENALPGMAVPLRMEELKLIINANTPFAIRHWNQQVLPRTAIREELINADAIRHERGATNHEIENQLFDELGMQTQTICQLGDYGALMRLVAGGMGYAIVSGDVVDREPNIKSWSLSPRLERANVLFIHPNVTIGSPEKYLTELIKGYRIFNK